MISPMETSYDNELVFYLCIQNFCSIAKPVNLLYANLLILVEDIGDGAMYELCKTCLLTCREMLTVQRLWLPCSCSPIPSAHLGKLENAPCIP